MGLKLACHVHGRAQDEDFVTHTDCVCYQAGHIVTQPVLSTRPHCDSHRAPRRHAKSVFQIALFNDVVSC